MAFRFIIIYTLLAVASAGLISQGTHYVAPAVAHKLHYANPAVDSVATTHQNVVRSFDGTVSHHSKSVDTPYSSVRKEDTRISNNVYTPAIAKAVSYAAPAPTTTVYTHATPVISKPAYSAPSPTAYIHYQQREATPTVYSHHQAAPTATVYTHSTPVVAKSVTYAAPAPIAHVYHQETPAPQAYIKQATATHIYQQAAPAPQVYLKQSPTTQIYRQEAPASHVYQHAAPTTTTTTTSYNHGPAASTYTHNAPGVAAYGSSQTVKYSPAESVSHMSFDGFGTHWGF